jgi:AraC-like DNA-binding protein
MSTMEGAPVAAKLRSTARPGTSTRADRQELVALLERCQPRDGVVEAAPGVVVSRFSAPTRPAHGIIEPSFCVIAQGSKVMLLGRESFRYDPSTYLLISAGLPLAGEVVEASPARPCLSVVLRLDPGLITSVLVESNLLDSKARGAARALVVSRLDDDLLDAVVRIVRLVHKPDDFRALAPLAMREIVYRLAVGEQQLRLRQLAVGRGRVHRIARAIEQLRQEFNRPLRIGALARQLGMSTSGLHHQFKEVTAMSPLQFQKQLRLQEARRLLLSGDYDAATAGFQVGYEDAAYFSREYKRHFGQPPIRDLERLRSAAHATSGTTE